MKNLQLETIRLCKLWLDLLDHAGAYAERYGLSCALECSFGERYHRACATLTKSYKTQKNLSEVIQCDLDSFPSELRDICAAQVACNLPAFSERKGYLEQIMMGLTMVNRHGKERRSYYRRQIEKILDSATIGQATALSLNQLEAGFKESQKKSAARRAKKAA